MPSPSGSTSSAIAGDASDSEKHSAAVAATTTRRRNIERAIKRIQQVCSCEAGFCFLLSPRPGACNGWEVKGNMLTVHSYAFLCSFGQTTQVIARSLIASAFLLVAGCGGG